MKLTTIRTSPLSNLNSTKRYGITERKKTELDALTLKVSDAQHDVEQYQAIVTALTEKSNNFLAYLATADNDKTQAYNNKIFIDQTVQSALDLQNNSDIAFGEIVLANASKGSYTLNIINSIEMLIPGTMLIIPAIPPQIGRYIRIPPEKGSVVSTPIANSDFAKRPIDKANAKANTVPIKYFP